MYGEMTRYQAQHHPAAAIIATLIFGPLILAALLIYVLVYGLAALTKLIFRR